MPEKTISTIHQLKVSLSESRPLIWRSIQVPSQITLPQLHLALQIVMGWENYHFMNSRSQATCTRNRILKTTALDVWSSTNAA